MTQEQNPNPDELYDQLKQVEPARVVPIPEDGEPDDIKGATMGERSESSPKLSDFQSALKVLLPKMESFLDVIQVSRIFPDVYNPMFSLLVKGLLEEVDDMSMSKAIAYVNTALSIAIDGEGRIDITALYGRASETEMEKTKASAGLV